MAAPEADGSADGAAEAGAEVAAGGSYALIRRRLEDAAAALAGAAQDLNERRTATFGGQELKILASERIRTEHNCVPRDIVRVRDRLVLGYNVSFAMKKEVVPGDVLSVHRFEEGEQGYDLAAVPDEVGLTGDAAFRAHFAELYQYYKNPRLELLRPTGGKLLAIFRIGERPEDIRAFRWAMSPGQALQYIDNRGERDHVWPASHDFDWVQTTRDDHVLGRHPHISILDEVFVETVGGDLTIKVEDNTEDGAGIYAEPVDDPHQSLDDAEILYAKVGTLILLRMRPFGETAFRHLVFNTRTQAVTRIDAIGDACLQLPEDHGILFPGGIYLRSGVYKVFEDLPPGMRFKRVVRAPNGEDVLYVFHEETSGRYVLLPYNLIRQEVSTPIQGHGQTLFEDGRLVVLRADSDEPARVHPVQIWRTPFMSEEHAAKAPSDGSPLARLGNAELVRAVSELFALERMVSDIEPSRRVYEDLVAACTRTLDAYPWLSTDAVGGLDAPVREVRKNAELIIDEFTKLQALKAQARAALTGSQEAWRRLELDLQPDSWREIQDFMGALTSLRDQRGHIITLRDMRSIDRASLDALEEKVVAATDRISVSTVQFLLQDAALAPLRDRLTELDAAAEALTRTPDIEPLIEELAETSRGIDVLVEVAGGLEVGDPADRTAILERIGEVSAQLNRARAVVEARRKTLRSGEARAEFAAQFRLLGQSVQSALSRADSPETCDDQLSRVMVQLEELEGRFGEFEEFLGDLISRREEVLQAFESKRQSLVDARNRRIEALFTSAERILESVGRRAATFKEEDRLNAYFASDPMVMKLRKTAEQLEALGDSVKAGELEGRLKAAGQLARRGLRDKQDLFEEGDLIRLGRHRFSVNTQNLELTLVPRGDGMAIHLTGTEFYQPVTDPGFLETKPYWSQLLPSETTEGEDTVYRGEYLAASILFAAERHEGDVSLQELAAARVQDGGLGALVRKVAASRYDEGYELGIHDHDAALILDKVLHLRDAAGLLRHPPTPRALACLWWAFPADEAVRDRLHRRARSLARLDQLAPNPKARARLAAELAEQVDAWVRSALPARADELTAPAVLAAAGRYLTDELAAEHPRFVVSADALALVEALHALLDAHGDRARFDADLEALSGDLDEALELARGWLEAVVAHAAEDAPVRAAGVAQLEAAVLLVTERVLDREPAHVQTATTVEGLLGQHPRITDRVLPLRLDAFLDRLTGFVAHRLPGYHAYRQARHALLERETHRLRIEEFKPRVMTSFVRNQLIDQVYLPIIGDNLAKQMGAAGAARRTDTMGLLLLISPPGYGKTTLMEYVASQLGIVFMKVNGPSLGHDVKSLDPAEAPSATARQEVEKINLAFEMGNNVMLYLDDIQHTHPELLQKFISLCDGTRRIEGVWDGRTRTYDLRGKKFCVVMAGNPYTESGDKFQVPDMLANRADTYNLGDILGGRQDLFALSYIENCVTSSATLTPVGARAPDDLHRFVRLAEGRSVDDADFSHDWSAGDRAEIVSVLQKLFACRDTLLTVNQAYISSAATDERARTEPRFQLQGSYRNMAKLAEKVVPAMNDGELEQLIVDHYTGEAQTLTTGAESNLLKLAQLRGTMTDEQAARFQEIKEGFGRAQLLGGAGEDDPVARVTAGIFALQGEVKALGGKLGDPAPIRDGLGDLGAAVRALQEGMEANAGVDAAVDRLSETLVDVLVNRPAPTAAPTKVVVEAPPAAAPAPAPDTGRGWFEPGLELSAEADLVLRHAVLLEVQRALVTHARMQSGAHRQLGQSELVLTGVLPVMQMLAERLTGLAGTYVPDAERGAFLDALRRSVATAIRDLSAATGEAIEAPEVALPPAEATPEVD